MIEKETDPKIHNLNREFAFETSLTTSKADSSNSDNEARLRREAAFSGDAGELGADSNKRSDDGHFQFNGTMQLEMCGSEALLSGRWSRHRQCAGTQTSSSSTPCDGQVFCFQQVESNTPTPNPAAPVSLSPTPATSAPAPTPKEDVLGTTLDNTADGSTDADPVRRKPERDVCAAVAPQLLGDSTSRFIIKEAPSKPLTASSLSRQKAAHNMHAIVLAALLIAALQVSSLLVQAAKPANRALSKCDRTCEATDAAVCGDDDVTYANYCFFSVAACKNKTLALAYTSPCVTSDKADDAAASKNTCGRFYTCEYEPVCGSDGVTYGNACTFDEANCRAGGTLTIKAVGHERPGAADASDYERVLAVNVVYFAVRMLLLVLQHRQRRLEHIEGLFLFASQAVALVREIFALSFFVCFAVSAKLHRDRQSVRALARKVHIAAARAMERCRTRTA
ncbi:Secreted protein, partial [Globisporangium splendens]